MNKSLVILAALSATRVAAADPHHVLVLRSEGNADAGTRSKIDTQVLKLAKNIEGNVEGGDISYSDATTAAGCANPGDAACKDDVLATMGADELVVTTVTTAPGGELKVDVKRLAKGQAPKEATATVPAATPDAKLDADIGPMFGLAAPTPPPAPVVAKEPAKEPPPVEKPKPAPVPTPAAEPTHTAAPARTAQVGQPGGTDVTAAPNGQVVPTTEGEPGSRRLEITGMAVGGGLALLGIVMWAEADSTQSQINSAPTRSPKDFQNLQDLESQGDTYATLGNVMFIGGVAVAAVSTYFFFRDRHSDHRAQQARIVPTVFPHGGGLTLSFGGRP